jgi:hypothetical protein
VGGSTNSVQIAADADSVLGLSDGTIFMFYRFTDTTARTAQIAGFFPLDAAAGNRALLQPYSGIYYFDWGTARVSAAFTKTTSPTAVFAVSGGSKGKELWLGRVKIASAPADTTARTATVSPFQWGSPGGTGSNGSDAIELYIGATFNKALSDADIRELNNNPWQLFQAPAPIYLYRATSAGGPATGTFAATLGSVAMASSGSVRSVGSFASTMGSVTMSAAGSVTAAPSGTFASTLGGLTMSASGALRIPGTFAATMGGVSMAVVGSVGGNATGTFSATLGNVTMVAFDAAPVAISTSTNRRKTPRRTTS